jgi:hypothetical protein
MANYSGISGPPPKRSDEKLGHAHKGQADQRPIDKVEQTKDLRIPDPNPDWCVIALYAWQAYLDSPLKQFYTETDIAYGWMTANAIHIAATKGSAMQIAAAESMMRSALFNEADRRRVRVEVTRKEPEANPTAQKNKDELNERRRRRDAQ